VPDATARAFLLASLVVRLFLLPVGVVLVLVGEAGVAGLCTSVLAITGWVLWVVFLRGLAVYLKQPNVGEEAVRITFAAVWTVVGWIVALVFLVGFLALIALLRRSGGGFLSCFFLVGLVSAVAGTLRAVVLSGRADSLLTVLLYPTGIPLVMRYLDLISTLRMIILRRS
jgi:hypothetical protein